MWLVGCTETDCEVYHAGIGEDGKFPLRFPLTNGKPSRAAVVFAKAMTIAERELERIEKIDQPNEYD